MNVPFSNLFLAFVAERAYGLPPRCPNVFMNIFVIEIPSPATRRGAHEKGCIHRGLVVWFFLFCLCVYPISLGSMGAMRGMVAFKKKRKVCISSEQTGNLDFKFLETRRLVLRTRKETIGKSVTDLVVVLFSEDL